MRTTITVSDEIVQRAAELSGVAERSALVRHALETLIRVEAGRRLAALGGTDPAAESAPRRASK